MGSATSACDPQRKLRRVSFNVRSWPEANVGSAGSGIESCRSLGAEIAKLFAQSDSIGLCHERTHDRGPPARTVRLWTSCAATSL